MAKEKSNFKKFISGATWGGITGVIVGLLFAPKKGEETRKDVKESLDKVKAEADKHSDKIEGAKQTICTKANELKEKAQETIQKIKDKKKETLEEEVDEISDQVEEIKAQSGVEE